MEILVKPRKTLLTTLNLIRGGEKEINGSIRSTILFASDKSMLAVAGAIRQTTFSPAWV
jgi:hypothetical protein